MKIIYMVLGFLFLGLGAVGIVLPMVPTTPFFIASAFCFAKSSRRLHDWFLSTELYQKQLDSFVNEKTMTIKTKISILATVTILMGICFLLLKQMPAARIILVIVWICHVLYFLFRVKTKKEAETPNR